MIYGIGVDIVSNERIKLLHERFGDRFLHKIFSEREIEYCMNHHNPYPHLSARFAVKEALIKALKKPKGLRLKDIEVINSPDGSPSIFIKNKKNQDVLVTISHEKRYSVGFVIVLKQQ